MMASDCLTNFFVIFLMTPFRHTLIKSDKSFITIR